MTVIDTKLTVSQGLALDNHTVVLSEFLNANPGPGKANRVTRNEHAVTGVANLFDIREKVYQEGPINLKFVDGKRKTGVAKAGSRKRVVSMLDEQEVGSLEGDRFGPPVGTSIPDTFPDLQGQLINGEQGYIQREELESSDSIFYQSRDDHVEVGGFRDAVVEEKVLDESNSKYACKLYLGSDSDPASDDDNSSIPYGSLGKNVQDESKSHLNLSWLSGCYSEDEVAFGGADWIDYAHEDGGAGALNVFEDLLDATKKDHVLENNYVASIIQSSPSNNNDSNAKDRDTNDMLSEESVSIRGTGRPDLDDVEDLPDVPLTGARGAVYSPSSSNVLGSFVWSGSGRPNLEEDGLYSDFDDVEVSQSKGAEEYPGSSGELGFGILDCTYGHEPLGKLRNMSDSPVGILHASGSLNQTLGTHDKEKIFLQGRHDFVVRELFPEIVPMDSSLQLKPGSLQDPVLLRGQDACPGLVDSLQGSNKGMSSCEAAGTACSSDFVMPNDEPHVHQKIEDSSGDVKRKGCIMRLGSKEAEKILQMDVAKLGRAVLSPTKQKVTGSGGSGRISVDWADEDLGPDELSRYVETLEVKETYIDTVLDMEDVLFDSEEGNGTRILQAGKLASPGLLRPIRDGSLGASTSSDCGSGTKDCQRCANNTTAVEWVEVVGALQRRGGASLGERVVGVKEHTVYRMRVKSGRNEWEILRRYRDFVVLYHHLQQLFPPQKGLSLPRPWERVRAESRKFFGNTSPDVVEIRSALVQVCLQSLLQAGPPLSSAPPLLRFLSPGGFGNDSARDLFGRPAALSTDAEFQTRSRLPLDEFTSVQQKSPRFGALSGTSEHDQDSVGQNAAFGKTIRLIVQLHKKKSMKQQLQAQHYTCAGCYKHLELALGLVPGLVQNLGWRGPRLCEFSGQLFCSSCHLNETAIIPAWVLQRWDFAPRPVSQLAKAYLDSIYDKPMLCVSAVNPYLYARVPILAHLTDIRKKVSRMLACIRCPARARIQAMFGSRRYLLENNDFFALRDLADLSKGAFAVLPGYLQAISQKLSLHITRECLVCRELGEVCTAGDLCDDSFDTIYPFQDEKLMRCPKCQSPFHKKCFGKYLKCHSCTEGSSQHVLKNSPSISGFCHELSFEQGRATPSCLRTDIFSSAALTQEAQEHIVNRPHPVLRSKQSILGSLFGSREAPSSVSQKETQGSMVLNMSSLTSSLEL